MMPQMHRLERFLRQENADIISLQEINENNKRGLQVTKIKQKLHMNVNFGGNIAIGDGTYGIATFSKFPILERKHLLLTSTKEQRGLIDTTLKISDEKLHILNTHLGLSNDERVQQIKEISNYIKTLENPFMLMGDFNTTQPKFTELSIVDSARVFKKEHLPTMMLSNKRIDFIFCSPTIKISQYQVLQTKISDHYPVVVDFTFNN